MNSSVRLRVAPAAPLAAMLALLPLLQRRVQAGHSFELPLADELASSPARFQCAGQWCLLALSFAAKQAVQRAQHPKIG